VAIVSTLLVFVAVFVHFCKPDIATRMLRALGRTPAATELVVIESDDWVDPLKQPPDRSPPDSARKPSMWTAQGRRNTVAVTCAALQVRILLPRL
jgi:hypothetical protein